MTGSWTAADTLATTRLPSGGTAPVMTHLLSAVAQGGAR